jgi:hypothetical protein
MFYSSDGGAGLPENEEPNMSHEWDRGMLNASSWHGLEEVGVMADAQAMITAGELTGAWPVSLYGDELFTATSRLAAPMSAIVGRYAQHPERVLGVVGDRYRATACEEWRSLVQAACAAGAQPTGAFSLRDGSRVLATFEVGLANGLRTQLLIVDAFDGSMKLMCGFVTIRVVCANTLAVGLRRDGKDMAALRHTASLEEKVKLLAANIGQAVESSGKVRELYQRAEKVYLTEAAARTAFDALFPRAAKDASPRAVTMANKARREARAAAQLAVNKVGDGPCNLATLLNTGTWLVDRTAEGEFRDTRGESDALESLLLGSRADRVQEIQGLVEVILKDGTVEKVTGHEAIVMGIDPNLVGRELLKDHLETGSLA